MASCLCRRAVALRIGHHRARCVLAHFGHVGEEHDHRMAGQRPLRPRPSPAHRLGRRRLHRTNRLQAVRDEQAVLQTDPTVIYGVTKGQGVLGRGLKASELKKETPWNTYVIAGLPVTPICNPGRDAIEAALHPDTTEYLYFVADGTGGHAFATNLGDHNKNVAKYRAIEAATQDGAGD